jgi:hypothetical protein
MACRLCHKDGHWKKDCKIRQDWLKKKGQAAEADVAMSGIETEVLTTSIIEDNTFQCKNWVLDSASAVYICSHNMFDSV